MKQKPVFTCILIWLISSACSMAAVTSVTNTFSSAASIAGWQSVGAVSTSIKHDGNSTGDYDDGDRYYKKSYTYGMTVTGDGLKSDGGLRFNVQNGKVEDEAIGLTLSGTMEEEEVITFRGSFYNDNDITSLFIVQLWNLTDSTEVAQSGVTVVDRCNLIDYVPEEVVITTSVAPSHDGDELQLRIIDYANSSSRDIFLDSFELTSTPPEPIPEGTQRLVWRFNDKGPAGTILSSDLPRFDYTTEAEYDAASASSNTLAVNGRSTATDYIIQNKGDEHPDTLYLKTLDITKDDFGVYVQKIDFTNGGRNSTNTTRVSWSFDILGFDHPENQNLDPDNWEVNVLVGNNNPSLDITDAAYSGAVPAQTFSFADDSGNETSLDGTWTTVTGSYDIAVGLAGALGGIQITTGGANTGGYTSSGGVFLDNLIITLESTTSTNLPPPPPPPPPPQSGLVWDFENDGAPGTSLAANLARFDYTLSQEYDASTATTNTLAFNGRSTSSDYTIRDKGTGYARTLFFRTIDISRDDFGIYLQNIDFTDDGKNSTNITRVSWSFDILGYDSNGNLDPANWVLNILPGNTNQTQDVTDASYAAAVQAQTFQFMDDSTGETNLDGTWTTVTGSYDIAVGQAGTLGGIQITTGGANTGAYTSSGGIFLDNMEITLESSAVPPPPPPPPTSSLLWDFDSDGPNGTILAANTAQWDYTSRQAYDALAAITNTLAFNGRSTATDYIIRDKGGAHALALYFKTVNITSSDFGIYLQKLDFTNNGENSNTITRVRWSFDILGYDSNGNLDPADWALNILPGNTSQTLDVTDASYSTAVQAQTFQFTDDSTGETSTDGTWTTVTGSYDIAVGQAGALGGIQITTGGANAGGYTSAGGIFLDNIEITLESIPDSSPSPAPVASITFSEWIASYNPPVALADEGPGTGADESQDKSPQADPDHDGRSNLEEFGFGGHPFDASQAGYSPEYKFIFKDGDANWVYCVLPRRSAASLSYHLAASTNLLDAGEWTRNPHEQVGILPEGFGPEFDAVTNRIPAGDLSTLFIRLELEEVP